MREGPPNRLLFVGESLAKTSIHLLILINLDEYFSVKKILTSFD